jgi:thiamine biosynthesis lipoprotein
VVAPDDHAAHVGARLVGELERRWSRFLPTSEVSELNRRAGHLCIVSPETFDLVARAEDARLATDGMFNPLVLDRLVALGYDRTWEAVAGDGAPLDGASTVPSPLSEEPIELLPAVHGIRLPAGVRFDPGGIGKGFAADLVAERLRSDGVAWVQVELGGDLRVVGDPPGGGPWRVRIDDQDHGRDEAGTIDLSAGGVATSSRRRRRWRRGGLPLHHLIDPRTGLPASTDLDAVTAVAAESWWAEVVAKVALVRGSAAARDVFERHRASGVLVHAAGFPCRYEAVGTRAVAA